MTNNPQEDFISTEEYAWKVHDYLNDYIKFGDSKAAFVCALAGGILVWFGTSTPLIKDPELTCASICGYLAAILFATSFVFAFFAVWPNLVTQVVKRSRHRISLEADNSEIPAAGFIFWKNILAHVNQATYTAELLKQDSSRRTQHICMHSFELAGICDSKFTKINRASIAFGLATVFAVIYFLVTNWSIGLGAS